MKIVIAGGTGQVGRVLQRALSAEDEVVLFSRNRRRDSTRENVRVVEWDGERVGEWTAELEGADVLINLAGRSVNCRYGPENRREIIDSRVKSTRALGAAMAKLRKAPGIWLQASTATIYAHVPPGGAGHDENGTIGGQEPGVPETWKFSIAVATAWESAFDELQLGSTRKVKLRSAMIMSPDQGGVFDTLLGLVKRGLGGRAGNGKQYVSWIHESDFVSALRWIIAHEEFSGAVNICSPNPLSNEEFMRQLRSAAGVGWGLPATNWMLEIGAVFLRTETELILKSRRVIPGRLLRSGFRFEHPDWKGAAEELWKRGRQSRMNTHGRD